MNFDQWYYKQNYPTTNDAIAEVAWDTCKSEILSLLAERSGKCCGTKAIELDRMAAVIRRVV